MKTIKLLNEFYKREVLGQLKHKIFTYSHFFIYNSLRVLLTRNITKKITRGLKIDFIRMRIKLKDGLIINHYLGDYPIFFEHLLFDQYRLKELKENSIIIDIGANIGLVSLLLSKRYKANKIYSFEPNSNNFYIFQKNVWENNIFNIELNKKAVSNKKGETKLFLYGAGSHTINLKKESNKFEIVSTVYLDMFNFPNIDLLKIDVEGAELDILKGAIQTLKKVKLIWIELTNICPREKVIKLLQKNNFLIYTEGNMLKAVKNDF